MEAVINIKTKRDLKTKAQELAAELGLSLSAVLNGYLRQFIRNKAVNFSLAPQMTPALEETLSKIEYDIQRDRNLSTPITSKEGLNAYLANL
ncbi:type II toxin-antitoxin system RelB/DinJ family antitoxin [Candidatus Parcubacteria bacterium]|nr:type II toxin-antitoxin system RelB/DinJ family antitoxin [Candidatus Parcubacteria bacterium]